MRILLAIDDSQCSQAAARIVISQNAPANTEVRILHVVDSLAHLSMYDAYGPSSGIKKLEQERLAHGEEIVKRAAETLRSSSFDVTTVVEEGDPKTKIIEVAAVWNADMIVMGSHGRSRVDRFLLGSVSEAVARYAPCSIEIIRDASAIQLALEHAGPEHSEKCGHPSCTCTTKSGKYCSAQCEAVSQIPDIDCRCGHPGCKGRAH